MYAIIETGGKQYRVSEGDVLKIEKLEQDQGETTFEKVLMVSDGEKTTFGTPYVESAKVTAEILGVEKAKKILVFKKKPRKNHRKLRGHRQQYTKIKIKEISLN